MVAYVYYSLKIEYYEDDPDLPIFERISPNRKRLYSVEDIVHTLLHPDIHSSPVTCKKVPQYKAIHICSHVVAAAEISGDLDKFLCHQYQRGKQLINLTELATHGMPAGAGRKGGKLPKKKPRRKRVCDEENRIPLETSTANQSEYPTPSPIFCKKHVLSFRTRFSVSAASSSISIPKSQYGIGIMNPCGICRPELIHHVSFLLLPLRIVMQINSSCVLSLEMFLYVTDVEITFARQIKFWSNTLNSGTLLVLVLDCSNQSMVMPITISIVLHLNILIFNHH